jgi:hypothetical protein
LNFITEAFAAFALSRKTTKGVPLLLIAISEKSVFPGEKSAVPTLPHEGQVCAIDLVMPQSIPAAIRRNRKRSLTVGRLLVAGLKEGNIVCCGADFISFFITWMIFDANYTAVRRVFSK